LLDVFKNLAIGIKKHKKISILLVLLSIIIFTILFVKSQDRRFLLQKEYDKFLNFPTSYTVEQILQNGFADLDVTNILSEPSEKVSYFLEKVRTGEWAVLRTISETDEDLIVTLYVNDDTISQIRRYKYFVKQQSMLFPDTRFESPYTSTENGITTVYLTHSENIKKNPEDVLIEDDSLYSYYE